MAFNGNDLLRASQVACCCCHVTLGVSRPVELVAIAFGLSGPLCEEISFWLDNGNWLFLMLAKLEMFDSKIALSE